MSEPEITGIKENVTKDPNDKCFNGCIGKKSFDELINELNKFNHHKRFKFEVDNIVNFIDENTTELDSTVDSFWGVYDDSAKKKLKKFITDDGFIKFETMLTDLKKQINNYINIETEFDNDDTIKKEQTNIETAKTAIDDRKNELQKIYDENTSGIRESIGQYITKITVNKEKAFDTGSGSARNKLMTLYEKNFGDKFENNQITEGQKYELAAFIDSDSEFLKNHDVSLGKNYDGNNKNMVKNEIDKIKNSIASGTFYSGMRIFSFDTNKLIVIEPKNDFKQYANEKVYRINPKYSLAPYVFMKPDGYLVRFDNSDYGVFGEEARYTWDLFYKDKVKQSLYIRRTKEGEPTISCAARRTGAYGNWVGGKGKRKTHKKRNKKRSSRRRR